MTADSFLDLGAAKNQSGSVLMNVARIEELMDRHGLDAIIGTTLENLTYLTGLVGWSQRVYRDTFSSFAVLTRDGQLRTDLVIGRGDIASYVAEPGFASRVTGYGEQPQVTIPAGYRPDDEEQERFLAIHPTALRFRDPGDAIEALLDEPSRRGRIAIDEDGCPEGFREDLARRLPDAEIVNGSNLLRLMRLAKTSPEIDLMGEAARINESGVAAMLSRLRPKIRERELAMVWYREVARPGVIPLWCFVGSGPRSAYNYPPSERRVAEGDLFMYDVGLTYRNYYSDVGGSGVVGELSAESQKIALTMEGIFAETLEGVRAQVSAGGIFERMKSKIDAAGLPSANMPHAGHTLGLEARELPGILGPAVSFADPLLPETSDFPLPDGTVLNIEYPMGIAGTGGFQFETTVVLRGNGWDPITTLGGGFQFFDA